MPHQFIPEVNKPRLYSEYILFAHTILTILLSSSGSLVWYLNFFSVFSAALIFWELVISKGWRPGREWLWVFTPLILIAIMALIAVFFDPTTKHFGFKIAYAYVLAFMYYCVALASERIWFLAWGLFVAFGIIFIDQGFGASALVIETGNRASLQIGTSGRADMLNVNTYGLICLMSMAFALYSVLNPATKNRSRVVAFGFKVFCLIVVIVALQQIMVVTGSRKSMIFASYWMVVASLMWMRGRITFARIAWAGLFGLSLLVISLVALYFSPFFWRLEEIYYGLTGQYTDEMSFIVRKEYMIEGIKLWLNSPIWGDFCITSKSFGTYSHSNPVELLANHGIIGFGLYKIYYFNYVLLFFLPCFMSGVNFLRAQAFFIGCFFLMFFLWEFAAVNYYERYSWPVIGTLLGMASMNLRRLHAVRGQGFAR